MVRQAAGGGVLVAMPTALVPAGTLPVDPSETDTVGLNTHMELPGVRRSGGGMEQIGVDIGVYVVDLGVEALRGITPLSLVPETEDQGLIGFGEDLDIIPDPTLIVQMVQEWLASTAGHRAAFYFAEEGVEQEEVWAAHLPSREELARGMSLETPRKPKDLPRRRGSQRLLCPYGAGAVQQWFTAEGQGRRNSLPLDRSSGSDSSRAGKEAPLAAPSCRPAPICCRPNSLDPLPPSADSGNPLRHSGPNGQEHRRCAQGRTGSAPVLCIARSRQIVRGTGSSKSRWRQCLLS